MPTVTPGCFSKLFHERLGLDAGQIVALGGRLHHGSREPLPMIGTLVEWRTRYLVLVPVPTGRPTAAAMREGIITAR